MAANGCMQAIRGVPWRDCSKWPQRDKQNQISPMQGNEGQDLPGAMASNGLGAISKSKFPNAGQQRPGLAGRDGMNGLSALNKIKIGISAMAQQPRR
jgi:hypothetical protein